VLGGVRDWGAAAVGWSDDDDERGGGGGGGQVGGMGVNSGQRARTDPLAAGTTTHRNGLPASWPERCAPGLVPIVFPNSSVARSVHMAGLTLRIGGCSEVVAAVMRDSVTTRAEGKRESRLVLCFCVFCVLFPFVFSTFLTARDVCSTAYPCCSVSP
jgi:hypothetical protein